MSVKSFLSNVVGFIGHYSTEAMATATALEALVTNIPIPKPEAAKILDVIEQLKNGAANIATALPMLQKQAVPVTINAKDIEAAVAKVLPDLVDAAVAKALAAKDDGK